MNEERTEDIMQLAEEAYELQFNYFAQLRNIKEEARRKTIKDTYK